MKAALITLLVIACAFFYYTNASTKQSLEATKLELQQLQQAQAQAKPVVDQSAQVQQMQQQILRLTQERDDALSQLARLKGSQTPTPASWFQQKVNVDGGKLDAPAQSQHK